MSTAWIWGFSAIGVFFIAFLISQKMWKPFRWAGYALFKVVLGAILLFILNSIAGYYHFTIPINPVTAFVTGFLGIPGLLSMIVMKHFILV
jgi:inhibitor of the pro-sigma K processing machinery